jgi:hypothetical protein
VPRRNTSGTVGEDGFGSSPSSADTFTVTTSPGCAQSLISVPRSASAMKCAQIGPANWLP